MYACVMHCPLSDTRSAKHWRAKGGREEKGKEGEMVEREGFDDRLSILNEDKSVTNTPPPNILRRMCVCVCVLTSELCEITFTEFFPFRSLETVHTLKIIRFLHC